MTTKMLAMALCLLAAGCSTPVSPATGASTATTLEQAKEEWAKANGAQGCVFTCIGQGTVTASYTTVTTSTGLTYQRPNTTDWISFRVVVAGTERFVRFTNPAYDSPDRGWRWT